MKKWLLTALGAVALAVGAVGIVLPVLPTTPLVLLAAGCFAGADPRLYARLARSPVFGEYIRNYREKTGVRRRTKVCSLLFLWLTLGLSAYFAGALWLRLLLLAVGVGVSVHLIHLPTCRP